MGMQDHTPGRSQLSQAARFRLSLRVARWRRRANQRLEQKSTRKPARARTLLNCAPVKCFCRGLTYPRHSCMLPETWTHAK